MNKALSSRQLEIISGGAIGVGLAIATQGFAFFSTMAGAIAGWAFFIWYGWVAYNYQLLRKDWFIWGFIPVWAFIGFVSVRGDMTPALYIGWTIWWLIVRGVWWVIKDYFFPNLKPQVRRGSVLLSTQRLSDIINQERPSTIQPQIEIGGVPIPNYYENLSFFFTGVPGSGKSTALKRIIDTLRQRDDWRGIILDRNGELMESFYDPDKDVIFNPRDARSVCWNHRSERARPETLSTAILPDPQGDDIFFVQGARAMLADLYKRADNNSQIWEIINTFSVPELQEFLQGTPSEKYFTSEKTAGSILATLINDARFYGDLAEIDPAREGFSFYHWAKSTDPRWVWVPLFEDDSAVYKPLITGAFELALKGLLSDEGRSIRTGFFIDELGAIAQLKSLPRLLSEGRKFNGAAFLGAQTAAQIRKTYGEDSKRIILQGCATKLILRCGDPETSKEFAEVIGRQEIQEMMVGFNSSFMKSSSVSRNMQVRERFTVEPTELQHLPALTGVLSVGGQNPAPVALQPKSFENKQPRLVERKAATAAATSSSDDWWQE